MAVQISGNDITVPRDGSFTRNVTIGGTLTYEDVTNIDSVGLVTARNGIEIGARPGVAASISVDGNMIVSGISTFGGDVQVPDKIIHSGDTNTAIRFPAADTITAETGGSERLRIDSSGRLLLGTTTEGSAGADEFTINIASGHGGMTIRNDTSSNGNIWFSDGTSGDAEYRGIVSYNHASDFMRFYTSATERLRITSDGKIGIGDDNPSYPLVISYTDNTTYSSSNFIANGLQIENTSTTDNTASGIFFTAKGSGANAGAAHINCIRTANGSGALAFSTRHNVGSHVERLRIDSTGRLLLGTTNITGHAVSSSNNPLLQLESTSTADYARASFIFNGNNGVGPGLWFAKSRGTSIGSNTIINDGDQIGGLFFHAADGTDKHSRCASIEVKIDGAPGANDTPGLIRFLTTPDGSAAAEEKVRIPASTWGLLVTNQSSTGSTGGYQTEGVSLRYTGDSTFVKTDAAAVTMTRKGNAGKVLDFYSGTSYAGGVYVNGQNSASYQSSSDYRLKDNVNSISDGISKVKQLNPIYYTNKQIGDVTDTSTVYNGFLAHEVQSVIPTLVNGEKDADVDERGKGYQTLNYAGFAPTAIAAIKELIAKVETLESKVAALEGS